MAQTDGAAAQASIAIDNITVVIPVWNGAEVIGDCLRALYAGSGPRLRGVIAVDNDSSDESAALIAREFPGVHLLRSSFNVGFAGGVNLGVEAATALTPAWDAAVLLNQDCLVEDGWLDALCEGMESDPQAAIGGCTILHADGSVNHAGARLQPPSAFSQHLTSVSEAPERREYVTGAAFAIRRSAWNALGPLDEEFFPAYYEEADYCYRARRQGWGVLYVPAARVRHLQMSQAWRKDPLLYWTQQHRSRYRFVAKHFGGEELSAFCAAEYAAIETEEWFDQCMGRALAARHTIRGLEATWLRRRQELDECPALADKRRLQVELAGIAQVALHKATAYVHSNLLAKEVELEAEREEKRQVQREARTRSQRMYHKLGLLYTEDTFETRDLHGETLRSAQLYVLTVLTEYDYR